MEQLRAAPTAARKDRDTARTPRYAIFLSDLKNRESEVGRELAEELAG